MLPLTCPNFLRQLMLCTLHSTATCYRGPVLHDCSNIVYSGLQGHPDVSLLRLSRSAVMKLLLDLQPSNCHNHADYYYSHMGEWQHASQLLCFDCSHHAGCGSPTWLTPSLGCTALLC